MPPSIVAFTVTPTSGNAPYLLTAVFDRGDSFVDPGYALEARATTRPGSCLLGLSQSANVPAMVTALLDTGEFSMLTDVPANQCRTISLIVRNTITGDVLDSKNVYINNIV